MIKQPNQPELKSHPEYFILGNNPEIAEFMARPDMQRFMMLMLSDIDDNFKDFIRKTHLDYYRGLVTQLKNSYTIMKSSTIEKVTVIEKLKRSYDGKIFKVGDKIKLGEEVYTTGRMHIDSGDNLHIRLDSASKDGIITWRTLKDL